MVEGTEGSSTEPSGGEESAGLEGAVARWAEKGLAQYLEDADLVSELIDWLYEETKVNKALLRLAVKPLSTLVSVAVRRGGGWLSNAAKQRLERTLRSLPFYGELEQAIDKLVTRLDRELAAKKEVKEILAGRRPARDAEFASDLTLDLQTQVKALQALDKQSQQIADGFVRIEGLLKPQPLLHLRLLKESPETRFVYAAQKVPFFGRETELSDLVEFLYANDPFTWWIVVGGAGEGKSRLALELCLSHGMPWRVGFMPSQTDFKEWHRWQPERPTLLIADYASARPKELGDVVLSLCDRKDLDCPVRLLLFERDAEGPWWSEFSRAGTDRHAITAVRYQTPLALEPLDDDALWRIIDFLVREAGQPSPDQASTLAGLKAVDPSGRPLFAAFFADALANNREPRDWDRTALIKDVLQREDEKYWQPARVTEKDKNLLALATMTGGMELDRLPTIETGDLLPNTRELSPDRYRVLSGQPATDELAPLEPDILGELFVLEHLKPAHRLDQSRAETLRRAAWECSPLGMFQFLSRAAMDFPDHEVLRLLDRPATESEIQCERWAAVAVNLIFAYGAYGDAGYVEEARGLYDDLAGLAAGHLDEPALREQQAKGAVNLIVGYGKAGDVEAARGLYDNLAGLAAAQPDEPALSEIQANAAVNLIVGYVKAGDVEAARGLYDDLTGLAAAHPDEPALREIQAKGAVNLITGYGKAGDVEAARGLYDDLAGLAAAHPDELALREQQANGAFNLINVYDNAGDVEAARGLYDDLAGLAAAHPDELALRGIQALGALILMNSYRDSGDDGALKKLLKSINETPNLQTAVQALLDNQKPDGSEP